MLLLKLGQLAAGRGWAVPQLTRMMSFVSHSASQQHRLLALRQKLLTTTFRLFSREMPRLPLDAEHLSALITKDITVFTYTNNRFFLLLTIFGGMQFIFWTNLAVFVNADPTVGNSGESRIVRFYIENRQKIAASCICLGNQVI